MTSDALQFFRNAEIGAVDAAPLLFVILSLRARSQNVKCYSLGMGPKSVVITVRTADDDWMLLRVSVIAMSKKRTARQAAGELAPMAAADYVLELKLCEHCGRQFLRPIGSEVKLCAGRHSAPVRPGDLRRLAAAFIEGEEGQKAARR